MLSFYNLYININWTQHNISNVKQRHILFYYICQLRGRVKEGWRRETRNKRKQRMTERDGWRRSRRRSRKLTWMLIHFEFRIRELVMNNASVLLETSIADQLEIESALVKRRFRVKGLVSPSVLNAKQRWRRRDSVQQSCSGYSCAASVIYREWRSSEVIIPETESADVAFKPRLKIFVLLIKLMDPQKKIIRQTNRYASLRFQVIIYADDSDNYRRFSFRFDTCLSFQIFYRRHFCRFACFIETVWLFERILGAYPSRQFYWNRYDSYKSKCDIWNKKGREHSILVTLCVYNILLIIYTHWRIIIYLFNEKISIKEIWVYEYLY